MMSFSSSKTYSLARWSFILGIVGFLLYGLAPLLPEELKKLYIILPLVCIFSVLAFVFAIIAITKIKKSQGFLKGEALAWSGLILGGGLIISIVITAIFTGLTVFIISDLISKIAD
jgi:cytochrome bd-type quinol oxidase subunit 2